MPEGVNAVDASTALSRFCNGEGLFFPSGNWNLDTVAKALGDDVQFFAFPCATSEDEPNVAANAGAFYGIDAYADVLMSGHTSDFINNATAGMQSSGLIPNFQLLLDNSITPQEFTKNVQAQYDKEAKQ